MSIQSEVGTQTEGRLTVAEDLDSRRTIGVAPPFLDRRRAGVLLHPTSLPGGTAAGDLGPQAWRFVDFLAGHGFGVWQMLPLGPTHDDGSPYDGLSVHAGNPALISLERLVEAGWLEPTVLESSGVDPAAHRCTCLRAARSGFYARAAAGERAGFEAYIAAEAHWLEDYALFAALRAAHNRAAWWRWPPEQRDREPAALAAARTNHATEIAQAQFEQFVFDRQWEELKRHAGGRGVLLFGDLPIFVAHDSAEVWAHREYFRLDPGGQPAAVAGVPPDYFSATGQRWGNPLYDWERMRADGFRWWAGRLATEIRRFDLVRIDHFRGLEAGWEIPAAEPTAVHGRWAPGPGEELFVALRARLGPLPLVAEDLGLITPEVDRLRTRCGFPGMRVLQFAFDGNGANPHLPHNHEPDTVVYTGTHDNDTTLAWFSDRPPEEQLRVVEYLGYPHEPMPLPLIRAALASVARLAIVPMQDLLLLGCGHRMNTPGTGAHNWRWRFSWEQLAPQSGDWLRRAIRLYGRS